MDSKEIFYIRKQYNKNFKDDLPYEYSEKEKMEIIQLNYNNALELLKQDKDNIWNKKAYIYVASDICKIYAKNRKYDKIKVCINIINTLEIKNDDEILVKTINKIKNYMNSNNQLLSEIKQLRDKKEYESAYKLSKKIDIQQYLNDNYIVSSYIYPITDMCVKCYEQNKMDEFYKYYNELCTLKIKINNDFLAKRIAKINKLADITYKEQQEAKKLYNNKQYKEALEVYKNIIKTKNDISINMRTGWCIYHIIKENIDNKISDSVSKKLLMQYLDLNVEKPSSLHSYILRLAMDINNIKFYKFLELWNIQYFSDDDYKQVSIENHNSNYSSLVQKAISKAIKDTDVINNKVTLEKYLKHLNIAIEKANNDIFAVRIRAFINLYLDIYEESEKDFIYVLKNKINDYWAWRDFGFFFSKKNKTMETLGCYCKSLLLISNDRLEFSLDIRKKLIEILLELKLYNEAKYEINIVYDICKTHNYKMDDNIIKLMNSDWFISAVELKNNKKFYIKHSREAEKELYKQMNKISAVLGNKFENKSNKLCYNIYYKYIDDKNKISSYVVKNNMVHIEKKEEGTPIYVYIDYNKLTGKDEIYGIEARENGDNYDIIEKQIGVVSYIDKKTNKANIVVSKNITDSLYVDNKDNKLSVGDDVYVRVLQNNKKYKIATCEKVEEKIKTELKRIIFDTIEHISQAGDAYTFDTYIRRELVKENNLKKGDEVHGTSILTYNKKKSQWGWSALTVEKVILKIEDTDEFENDDMKD